MNIIVHTQIAGRKYRGVDTVKDVFYKVTIGDGSMIHQDLDTVKSVYDNIAKKKGGKILAIYKADNLI